MTRHRPMISRHRRPAGRSQQRRQTPGYPAREGHLHDNMDDQRKSIRAARLSRYPLYVEGHRYDVKKDLVWRTVHRSGTLETDLSINPKHQYRRQ